MTIVTRASFPRVDDQQATAKPSEESHPLHVFQPRPLTLQNSSPVIFPCLDGEQRDESESKSRRARELRLERELAEKAETVMAEAREQGREQGHAEGLSQGQVEGLEQGRAQAEEELKSLQESLNGIITSLTNARAELSAALELDIAEVVLALAGQLAGGAITVEPERIVELARQGLDLVAESDVITIKAAAGPASLLREEQEALSSSANVASLRIVEDPSLEPEGCTVESELGRVDLRVSQRLESARDLLNLVRNED